MRTMMFSAPKLEICSCAARLIPSPNANSQITLDTPIKIPNTVSDERSGCIHKLLTLSCRVRSQMESIAIYREDFTQRREDAKAAKCKKEMFNVKCSM